MVSGTKGTTAIRGQQRYEQKGLSFRMEPLSDDAHAIIAAFGAQRYQETGRPGMVVFIVSPTDQAGTMRHHIYYLTTEEIAAMLKVAQHTDQEREAFTLVIEPSEMRTEVIPRGTRH